jgi:Excreted virulence factor EspC, type VII ESX diderm
MNDQVFMNVPAVKGIAKTFGTVADVLKTVARILGIVSTMLKAAAFIGAFGGAALAQFIDQIKPPIEKLGEQCAELSRDVRAAVEAYERGDTAGALRFY